jgi:hypothetical protein
MTLRMKFRCWSRFCSARLRISAAAVLVVGVLAMLVATADGAMAGRNGDLGQRHANAVRAYAARLLPPRLHEAAARSTAAERAFVAAARALHRCLLEHPTQAARCHAIRKSLQRAGRRLTHAQRELSTIAVKSSAGPRTKAGAATGVANGGDRDRKSRGSGSADAGAAPVLSLSGGTLDWTRVDGLGTYVLATRVPGQASQYSLLSATAVTPPPVPGATVGYRVRTSAAGSAWSAEVSISYPPTPVEFEAPDPQSAPTLEVSGQTLTWNAVAGADAYVLATDVPGQPSQYSVLSATSTTPAAVPGRTVSYTVRTAVEGSAWSTSVAIAYPSTEPTGPPAEAPAELQTGTELQTGINSGSEPDDLVVAATLGAKLVRVGFPIEDTAAQLEPTIEKYADEGIKVLPLAYFTGTMPSPSEAQRLSTWADAYGPGGRFWNGRPDGSLAVRSIEFGNETDYSQQYHDEPGDPSYTLRAETYAVRVREAAQSIRSSGSTVGLLVQADDTTGDWINAMYAAVPELTKYVAGWTMHPYGGREWNEYRFHHLLEQAAEHGASSVPIDVTEWGVSSDNGRCLEYNDGLNRCMTYQEAAEQVRSSLAWMKQMLGSKLVMFLFYQTGDQAPSGTTTNWEDYFGALQHEGQSKGPFTEAVESVLRS